MYKFTILSLIVKVIVCVGESDSCLYVVLHLLMVLCIIFCTALQCNCTFSAS